MGRLAIKLSGTDVIVRLELVIWLYILFEWFDLFTGQATSQRLTRDEKLLNSSATSFFSPFPLRSEYHLI